MFALLMNIDEVVLHTEEQITLGSLIQALGGKDISPPQVFYVAFSLTVS